MKTVTLYCITNQTGSICPYLYLDLLEAHEAQNVLNVPDSQLQQLDIAVNEDESIIKLIAVDRIAVTERAVILNQTPEAFFQRYVNHHTPLYKGLRFSFAQIAVVRELEAAIKSANEAWKQHCERVFRLSQMRRLHADITRLSSVLSAQALESAGTQALASYLLTFGMNSHYLAQWLYAEENGK